MTDPLARIEEGCYLAFRFMLRVSSKPTGCLEIREGHYGLRQRAGAYHPLESALIGEEVGTGDWKADAAARLGVTSAWIEGFLRGIAQAGEGSCDPDHVQGYLAAEELRQRRPGPFHV
jgi:hypothetical protein